jgi:anaerobic magnesium-protoporphyrin IX monomethyl ester cyclase
MICHCHLVLLRERNRYKNHIILTSRGCPFKCDFCDSKNMWTRRVRYRSSEHIASEVKTLAEIGIKDIGFRDDIFTLNKRHVESICRSLKNHNLDRIQYNIGSRIDTMDEDMIRLLKNLNIEFITFGVESGSHIIQKRMKKNLDISKVVPVIEKTNNVGFRTVTFFMLGHPGETEKDIKDTFSLIRDLSKYCKKNQISVNTVCPYPGTGYWEYAIKKHGNFIDFYKDSFRYYHQEKPFINITNMDDKLFHDYVLRINRFAKNANMYTRLKIAMGNPKLVFSKIRKKFLS